MSVTDNWGKMEGTSKWHHPACRSGCFWELYLWLQSPELGTRYVLYRISQSLLGNAKIPIAGSIMLNCVIGSLVSPPAAEQSSGAFNTGPCHALTLARPVAGPIIPFRRNQKGSCRATSPTKGFLYSGRSETEMNIGSGFSGSSWADGLLQPLAGPTRKLIHLPMPVTLLVVEMSQPSSLQGTTFYWQTWMARWPHIRSGIVVVSAQHAWVT